MMSIGLADGDELIVSADGSDEKKAIEEIEEATPSIDKLLNDDTEKKEKDEEQKEDKEKSKDKDKDNKKKEEANKT